MKNNEKRKEKHENNHKLPKIIENIKRNSNRRENKRGRKSIKLRLINQDIELFNEISSDSSQRDSSKGSNDVLVNKGLNIEDNLFRIELEKS